jgi:hypothetical protein
MPTRTGNGPRSAENQSIRATTILERGLKFTFLHVAWFRKDRIEAGEKLAGQPSDLKVSCDRKANMKRKYSLHLFVLLQSV